MEELMEGVKYCKSDGQRDSVNEARGNTHDW